MILIVTGLLAVCMMSREGVVNEACDATTPCLSSNPNNPCLLAGTCASSICGDDEFAADTVSCVDTAGAASTCNGAGACTVADPPPPTPPTPASPCPSTVCSPTPCSPTPCPPAPACAGPGACTSLSPGDGEDTDNCGDDWEWLWKEDSKTGRNMCKKNGAAWADAYCELAPSPS